MSQVSDAIKANRQGPTIDNLPDKLDANDPLVRRAHQGQGWGVEDQARYDQLKASKEKESASTGSNSNGAGSGTEDSKKRYALGEVPTNGGDARKSAKDRAVNFTKTHQKQNQNANQNNDTTTNINGDNNRVENNVDNSVRQYGGVNKSFVYNGSSNGNNYEDTPVSAGTMGGYFHDEDSPAKSAAFVDMYSTMNKDNQKKYTGGYGEKAVENARANSGVNLQALQQKISEGTKATRGRADTMFAGIFGDIWAKSTPEWTSTRDPEKTEKPDIEGMYDKYTKPFS